MSINITFFGMTATESVRRREEQIQASANYLVAEFPRWGQTTTRYYSLIETLSKGERDQYHLLKNESEQNALTARAKKLAQYLHTKHSEFLFYQRNGYIHVTVPREEPNARDAVYVSQLEYETNMTAPSEKAMAALAPLPLAREKTATPVQAAKPALGLTRASSEEPKKPISLKRYVTAG